MGHRLSEAWTHPDVRAAMADIQTTAAAAGLVTGIHAGTGQLGKEMADMGFRMITLASESQALRRGAALHLGEATAGSTEPAGPDGYLQ
jgi:2-keto-3-deoxy-L-rhamnonate aldolase RhmA